MATKKPLTPDQKFIAAMQLQIVNHEKRIRELERLIKDEKKEEPKKKKRILVA